MRKRWFYEHNITWIADPDHIVLARLSAAEARTWCTAVGLTGTLLTFSDKPQDIDPEKLDILRRIFPVIQSPVTRPAELCSIEQIPALWTLEVDRPWDRWLIVANMSQAAGAEVDRIDFAAVGLDPEQAYTIFDFWNQRFEGVHNGSFDCGPPAERDVQLYAVRAVRPHPWIVSNNRHISQGGASIQNLGWQHNHLAGTCEIVGGEPYVLTLYHDGWKPGDPEVLEGGAAVSIQTDGPVTRLILEHGENTTVSWRLPFTNTGA